MTAPAQGPGSRDEIIRRLRERAASPIVDSVARRDPIPSKPIPSKPFTLSEIGPKGLTSLAGPAIPSFARAVALGDDFTSRSTKFALGDAFATSRASKGALGLMANIDALSQPLRGLDHLNGILKPNWMTELGFLDTWGRYGDRPGKIAGITRPWDTLGDLQKALGVSGIKPFNVRPTDYWLLTGPDRSFWDDIAKVAAVAPVSAQTAETVIQYAKASGPQVEQTESGLWTVELPSDAQMMVVHAILELVSAVVVAQCDLTPWMHSVLVYGVHVVGILLALSATMKD